MRRTDILQFQWLFLTRLCVYHVVYPLIQRDQPPPLTLLLILPTPRRVSDLYMCAAFVHEVTETGDGEGLDAVFVASRLDQGTEQTGGLKSAEGSFAP